MIKYIASESRYISVQQHFNTPYYGFSSSGSGALRWNPSLNRLEVNDGNLWQELTMGVTHINLPQDVIDIIEWAREKRKKEEQWKSLAKNNQAVKIALENLEEAQHQLDTIANLAREYDTETIS